MNLHQYLHHQHTQHPTHLPLSLITLLEQVANLCADISHLVRQGALGGILGAAETENVQGEVQKKLDILANERLINGLMEAQNHTSPLLAAVASEEMETIYPFPAHPTEGVGSYLMLFDPLDGSSNIDVNVSIGTIFSILKKSTAPHIAACEQDFLQSGKQQIASGYCIYGPQTTLVLTVGVGVALFTLDHTTHCFVLTQETLQIPKQTKEYAINMSNYRHWATPMQRYIDECQLGQEGIRGKNFNMRWVGSMVADVHRILTRGGIFIYPWDRKNPQKPGKLRLMYEANPMSWIIEQAGGLASTATEPILTLQPHELHQRVSVVLGSAEEVERVVQHHLS